MGDRVDILALGDLDLALRDQRPGDGGAQQIAALIDRVGAEYREDIVAGKYLTKIFDIHLAGAELHGLRFDRLHIFALPQVGAEGHHLVAQCLAHPFQDDGSIQSAGVGEHDFLATKVGAGHKL